MNEDADPGLNEDEFFNLICQSPDWGNFDDQPLLVSQTPFESVPTPVELELESDSNLLELARNCSEKREELISESEILVPTKRRVFRSGKFEFR